MEHNFQSKYLNNSLMRYVTFMILDHNQPVTLYLYNFVRNTYTAQKMICEVCIH